MKGVYDHKKYEKKNSNLTEGGDDSTDNSSTNVTKDNLFFIEKESDLKHQISLKRQVNSLKEEKMVEEVKVEEPKIEQKPPQSIGKKPVMLGKTKGVKFADPKEPGSNDNRMMQFK